MVVVHVAAAGEAAGAINSTALNLSLLKDSSDESYASQRIQVCLHSLSVCKQTEGQCSHYCASGRHA